MRLYVPQDQVAHIQDVTGSKQYPYVYYITSKRITNIPLLHSDLVVYQSI